MATLLAKADITDELVGPVVTDADLTEADLYITEIAATVGLTLAGLPSTLPYKVKKLMIAHVCYEICKRKASSAAASFRTMDVDQTDKWTAKLPIFQKELETYEGQMTAEVMAGTTAPLSATIGIITIGRG